ncbi:hypothetical protein HK102_014079 [Quaeritorhiza haematococci]|nr:hypothetical protein HK102_014079 [Quaeritorhiza haematococci]
MGDGLRTKNPDIAVIHYHAAAVWYMKVMASMEKSGDDGWKSREFAKQHQSMRQLVQFTLNSLKKSKQDLLYSMLLRLDCVAHHRVLHYKRLDLKARGTRLSKTTAEALKSSGPEDDSSSFKMSPKDVLLVQEEYLAAVQQIVDETDLAERKWAEADNVFRNMEDSLTPSLKNAILSPYMSLEEICNLNNSVITEYAVEKEHQFALLTPDDPRVIAK